MSGANVHPHSECQNCGAALTGPYCVQCGQHDIEYHRSLGHFLEDSLEGLFHLDGKFPQSLRCLFTRPGFLTREFIAGRRMRYTNPLRFYIFASFLFFVITTFTAKFEYHVPPARPAKAAAAGNAAPSPGGAGELLSRLKSMVRPEVLGSPGFSKELMHLLPEALFICIPLLALLLKLAYVRSPRVYVEHLIFALHLQTFVLFAVLIEEGLGWCLRLIGPALSGGVQSLFQLWTAYMVYRAFRVVYQQGVGKSLLKMGAVGFCYYVIVALATVATGFVSLLIISHDRLPPV